MICGAVEHRQRLWSGGCGLAAAAVVVQHLCLDLAPRSGTRAWLDSWWDVSGFVPVGTTGTIDLGPYRPGRILRYDVYTAEFYLRTSTLYKHGKK